MRRFFMTAGLLLSGTLAASAQTMDGCAGIGVNSTPQLNGACTSDLGSSGGGTASGGSGTSGMAPLVVPNDPASQPGTIDGGTTSSIPGMPPLIVPNDPTGTRDRNGLSSGDSTPGSRSGAIPSPTVD